MAVIAGLTSREVPDQEINETWEKNGPKVDVSQRPPSGTPVLAHTMRQDRN
jgi:hypothetical protein